MNILADVLQKKCPFNWRRPGLQVCSAAAAAAAAAQHRLGGGVDRDGLLGAGTCNLMARAGLTGRALLLAPLLVAVILDVFWLVADLAGRVRQSINPIPISVLLFWLQI